MVEALLLPSECLLSITSFPRLGTHDFLKPSFEPFGPVAQSLFIPDQLINAHPRFAQVHHLPLLRYSASYSMLCSS